MARRCFFSFHYERDCHRAAQVRQIGSIEGNRPTTDNGWETIVRGGDAAIRRWIDDQMFGKSCTIVLVGSETANRKWINYEIIRSWEAGMGVVGIHIHGLKNLRRETSRKGLNPFDYIGFGNTARKLSSVVKCYDPPSGDSRASYAWVARYLAAAVEEAIRIRKEAG